MIDPLREEPNQWNPSDPSELKTDPRYSGTLRDTRWVGTYYAKASQFSLDIEASVQLVYGIGVDDHDEPSLAINNCC